MSNLTPGDNCGFGAPFAMSPTQEENDGNSVSRPQNSQLPHDT